jgi:hypothetical protein
MAGPRKTIASYDSKQIIMTYGSTVVGGYADGTFVKVTAAGDTWTPYMGADGEQSRALSADDTSTVEITLSASSRTNDEFSEYFETDKETRTNMQQLAISDKNGTSLHKWAQAYITKAPDWENGKENSDRVWTFQTGHPTGRAVRGGITK